jgi:hypothetical protein
MALANREHRNGGVTNDTGCNATQKQVAEDRPPMGSHHDKVIADVPGGIENGCGRIPGAHFELTFNSDT